MNKKKLKALLTERGTIIQNLKRRNAALTDVNAKLHSVLSPIGYRLIHLSEGDDETYEKALTSVERQYGELLHERDALRKKLARDIERGDLEFSQAQDDIDALEATVKDLRASLEEASGKITDLAGDAAMYAQQLKVTKSSLKSYKGHFDEARSLSQEYVNKAAQAEATAACALKAKETADLNTAHYKREGEKVRVDHLKLKKKYEALETQAAGLRADILARDIEAVKLRKDDELGTIEIGGERKTRSEWAEYLRDTDRAYSDWRTAAEDAAIKERCPDCDGTRYQHYMGWGQWGSCLQLEAGSRCCDQKGRYCPTCK